MIIQMCFPDHEQICYSYVHHESATNFNIFVTTLRIVYDSKSYLWTVQREARASDIICTCWNNSQLASLNSLYTSIIFKETKCTFIAIQQDINYIYL